MKDKTKFVTQVSAVLAILVTAVIGLGFLVVQEYRTAKALSTVLEAQATKEQSDQKLGQFAINAMFDSHEGSKLSNAHKQMLARSIVRVANDVFANTDQKEHFIMVVMMESGFQKYVQSPTGPKGLTQVAKASFREGLVEYCGVKDIADEDVWDTDLNLYAGACYFRRQIDEVGGNLPRAALRYNQGPYSAADKSYAKGGRVKVLEGLEYIAQITYLERSLTDEKVPGKPDYQSKINVKKESSKSK